MLQIATDEKPIRASMLPSLVNCTKGFMGRFMSDDPYEVGEAAQTGSMIHLGIQVYHSTGEKNTSKSKGIAAMEAAKATYPLGNLDRAKELLEKYVERHKSDPRGKVIQTEWKIRIALDPAPFDPTKKKIIIEGTVDQVRDLGNFLYVCDHKSGFSPGAWNVKYYAPQLAVYMIGAYEHYNKPVKGFVTRLQDLARSNLPFYWDMGFDHEGAYKILDVVRTKIAEIRAGIYSASSGKHCDYCGLPEYPRCVFSEGKRDVKAKGVVGSARTELKTLDQLYDE